MRSSMPPSSRVRSAGAGRDDGVSRPPRPPSGGLEGHEIKAIGFGLYAWALTMGVLLFVGGAMGLSGWSMVFAMFVIGPIIGVFVGGTAYYFAERAGAAAAMIYSPTGSSTPYQESFSVQLAMAMRGNVPAALASFEALMAGTPADPVVRLAAAEMYATRGGDPARAAELYRQARLLAGATRGHEMAATNALIDLYRGPLADPARMRSELRRLAERFAGSPAAEMAKRALAEGRTEPSEHPR